MQNDTSKSYKDILKTTQIIGFSQIFRILTSVVSTKFAAIFLGPIGVGLVGLITNTIGIIQSVTSFGINVSGVKEVAKSYTGEINPEFSKTILILQRWSIVIGIFGMLVTIVFSRQLSEWTLGSPDKYYWFLLLSVNFIFSSLAETRYAIMRGMRKVKEVAKSTVIASILTSISSIAVYYILGVNGIIPLLIITGIIQFSVYYYYTKEIQSRNTIVSTLEVKHRIKTLVQLGFLLSINVIFGQICNFILKFYLQHYGQTPFDLGVFQASSVLLVSYVGMIFTAMGTDFYPGLTMISYDNKKVKELVNHQIEIALLLITPAILLLYTFSPLVIQLLYSKAFSNVSLILKAGCFAVILKGITWPLAYIILAKSENKLYFFQEIMGDIFLILFGIIFYNYFGLVGLGIASSVSYLIYGVYIYWLTRVKFDFKFSKGSKRIISVCLLLGITASSATFIWSNYSLSIALLILTVLSIWFSYVELQRRVDLNAYLKKIKAKFSK
jgi:O-antigen/teichoic acid export membrane protein